MNRSRYSTVAIVLHWTIALLLIGNLVVGLLFDTIEHNDKPLFFKLIQLHKSTGITILALVVLRLAWRMINPPPRLPDHMTTVERALAKLSHWGFYVVMLALPLSGWAMVSVSAKRFPLLWYGTFEIPYLPAPKAWNYDGMHWFLGWLTLAMIALHVAAALKHQYMDRDNIFARMSLRRRPA